MVKALVLAYPDASKRYTLDTDVSAYGASAELSQCLEGPEGVVVYFSKTFSIRQRNYCVTRRELLNVKLVVSHFRSYFYGRQFRLWTDHASLK